MERTFLDKSFNQTLIEELILEFLSEKYSCWELLSLSSPFTFTLQDNTETSQTVQGKDSNKWQQWQLFCCSSQSVSVAAAVFCYVVKQTQDVVRLHRNIRHSVYWQTQRGVDTSRSSKKSSKLLKILCFSFISP